MPGHRAYSDSTAQRESDARTAANARRDAVHAAGFELAHRTPLPGATAKELAGPLALRAMRLAEQGLDVLEQGMGDPDERVRVNAARWAVQACPKVAALSPPDAPPAANAEERDTALRAALESPEVCALVVACAACDGAALREALLAAGWRAPDAD